MVKSIIKRIIVGVGIALVLMALKDGGLIANAYALSCDTDANSSIHPITSSDTLTWNIASGTNTPQWSGFDLSSPYRVNFPSGYDFIDIKVPVSWSIATTQSNVSPTVNTIDFSGVFYFLRLKNSRNSIGDYRGYYKDNYLYVRIYKTAVGDYFDITQFRVAVPSINYTNQTIRVWMYFTDWWQVEHYKCDSNAALQQSIEENTQATQDINNSINDESDADTGGFLEDIGQDYSNNPVSDLITMPITFLQRLNNNINGSCITWNLGSLLGTNLTMPCINLQQILGSTLYNLIDMAICLFLAYNLGLMCVTIWNNMTSLKDDFDDMYSPKHAYNGKHTGG